MAIATEPQEPVVLEPFPYAITSDVFEKMVEHGLIPEERRVFLWDGRLYEKMAKSLPHSAVQGAFTMALARRLPPGFFVSGENPVRLDNTHIPLPDLVVARGNPLDFYESRYPDGRDVEVVVEIAYSIVREDLGVRLSRYALTLPFATYVVADLRHHQVVIHTKPRAADEAGKGEYAGRVVVGRGEAIRIKLKGVEIEPIPWEEVMR